VPEALFLKKNKASELSKAPFDKPLDKPHPFLYDFTI
jgi:hypothetical protein